jgi:multidrug resistance efflux pump
VEDSAERLQKQKDAAEAALQAAQQELVAARAVITQSEHERAAADATIKNAQTAIDLATQTIKLEDGIRLTRDGIIRDCSWAVSKQSLT